MKRNKRTEKMLTEVYDGQITPDSSNDENGDPFAENDDINDPTYFPDEIFSRSCVSESSGTHQTCEYVSCSSEVFSACSKCNSFLCWDHFDNTESFNNCEFHNSTDQESIEIVDSALTGGTNNLLADETLTATNNDTVLCDVTNLTNQQHCEYKNCIADIFSTCIRCQGFLCILHFDNFFLDNDCTLHDSFSTESKNMSSIIVTKSLKAISKRKRNLGLEYVSSKKKRVQPRSLKSPCKEETCRLKCTKNIDEVTRNLIFTSYWSLGDINRQRDFIKNNMQEVKPKYRNRCENCSRKKLRSLNNAFYFNIEDKKIRVCKRFFKSTLDINDKVIFTVKQKISQDGFVTEDLRGKHAKHAKLTEETTEVRKFIDSIPRVESCSIRAQSTRQYIEGSKSLTQIYADYKKICESNSKKIVSKTTFTNIFHNDFNISFHQPKKHHCEVCVSYENSNNEEKMKLQKSFDDHQVETKLSRLEKNQDKEKVSDYYVVACYDLQAVLTAPRGEVSVFYYVSKLATYNLTVSELVTGLTTCFVWNEGQGQSGVTEIGSCILKFIEKRLENVNPEDLELVFYSDNCCEQHKNKMMIALYIYAVNKYKIKSITHKFLIKGHTQNEVDAVHSTIEKGIKRSLKSGPIYSPQEYVSIIKTAKKNPPYYTVQELSFNDFYDIKTMCDKIANNYSKTTDKCQIKLADIKIIQIRKDNPLSVHVKTSYADENFKRIEIRKFTTRKTAFAFPESLDKAYSKKMQVSEKKKQDILKLVEKRHIPQTYYDFYKSL